MRPIPTEPMLETCERCGKETRHEPDRMGAYHCTECRYRDAKADGRSVGRILVWCLVAVAAAALLLVLFGNKRISFERTTDWRHDTCMARGERYYRSAGTWPTLADGRDAADVVEERCDDNAESFPE